MFSIRISWLPKLSTCGKYSRYIFFISITHFSHFPFFNRIFLIDHLTKVLISKQSTRIKNIQSKYPGSEVTKSFRLNVSQRFYARQIGVSSEGRPARRLCVRSLALNFNLESGFPDSVLSAQSRGCALGNPIYFAVGRPSFFIII